MNSLDSSRPHPKRWLRRANSLSSKLVILLTASMAAIFGLFGYLNIRLHRRHLQDSALANVERVSDVIKRNASYFMLRNQRDGLYQIIRDMGNEPGMVRVRIINPEGRISFSSDPSEINTFVDKKTEACYGCHRQDQPLARLNRPDRSRIYRVAKGDRVLGIINPIENVPACSTAACHAHPASQKILGVLDTNLSLADADASLAQSTRQMIWYTFLATAVICSLSAIFVWRVVHGRLKDLKAGTERLASGELGCQLEVTSHDELADLAHSFNSMSSQLRDARAEITAWASTLETRVRQKTEELNRANEQMLRAEKMASIGKLAAVVAHEINNPLAGILTYAKLLRKRFSSKGDKEPQEIQDSLSLIESESRRCGEIVKNLLTFARATPMNYEPADLNAVIDRCVRLVRHKLELAGVELRLDLAPDLPLVPCDPAQIEQVLLSFILNAIDAMPKGGNLSLASRAQPDLHEVRVEVRDDGVGIPAEVVPRLFEPFFTTKEGAHGLGLGLAISQSIIERHQGRIEVASEPGRGTLFTVILPTRGAPAVAVGPPAHWLEEGKQYG